MWNQTSLPAQWHWGRDIERIYNKWMMNLKWTWNYLELKGGKKVWFCSNSQIYNGFSCQVDPLLKMLVSGRYRKSPTVMCALGRWFATFISLLAMFSSSHVQAQTHRVLKRTYPPTVCLSVHAEGFVQKEIMFNHSNIRKEMLCTSMAY